MKILRGIYQNTTYCGVLDQDLVQLYAGSPHDLGEPLQKVPLADIQLLIPSQPSQIICVGLNYADHAKELALTMPSEPLIFSKAVSALNPPQAAIRLPALSERVDFEGELAVVIGKTCRKIQASEASDYILGYTCCNDVTARDLQRRDGQFFRSKSFDTFACLGPWIETELDPASLTIQTRVNGILHQDANTEDMIFKVPELVAYISQVMTLRPGDVISTGSPDGVAPMKSGDLIEVSIEGIGTLVNPVVMD